VKINITRIVVSKEYRSRNKTIEEINKISVKILRMLFKPNIRWLNSLVIFLNNKDELLFV